MKRSSGILLPVFSLSGDYGIGTMGKQACDFVDFLHEAGQSWWQILPMGPTGGGNSPYTSVSTFAGNPWMIDPVLLAEDGLLSPEQLKAAQLPVSHTIDYGALSQSREALLRQAFAVGGKRDQKAVQKFTDSHHWVRNYALYMACKSHFDQTAWLDWPSDIRDRTPQALENYQSALAVDMEFHCYVQYLFFTQWAKLKAYANAKGVKIIGDLPIYVSLDSADVWGERKEFLLDTTGHPTLVSGVPPDYFCEDGQLWGNPLYDWNRQKADGFGWWIRRIEGMQALCDSVRIDHFRGLDEYWAVPASSTTAKDGAWHKGPAMDLLGVLTSWFPTVDYIAEDLGVLTDGVHSLRETSGLPGMRVLEFAFSDPTNLYLPHNYPPHCICYTGTHDNNTLQGWWDEATEAEKAFTLAYTGVAEDAVPQAVLRRGLGSVAQVFIAQLQDYLGMGSDARINVPGVAEGNWAWRLMDGDIPTTLAKELHDLTGLYSRL
ncbi:4-alpha-glucanotransferase [Bengtsoniella intestinalis]|uniref:4-alpha-glucanotransferase n=1 Tax=Bengtsoniella intestinalis TaxID=3073143 RepID=UPI00391FB636